MSDVTRILTAIERGDVQATDELLPIVYQELRRLAAQMLSRERPGQTFQATALVHEAYIRLVGSQDKAWQGRRYFFAAAAEAMRRILVEAARRKQQIKRGGGRQRVELNESDIASAVPSERLLAVNEVLDRLAVEDARAAELVKLRYFVGMSASQAAAAMGVSARTASRLWTYARAWLHDAVRRSQ